MCLNETGQRALKVVEFVRQGGYAEAGALADAPGPGIAADLIAVLVAVSGGDPRVLTIQDKRALPSGPFQIAHRSLQSALRAWVERQTRLPLGYVEQLYTFADKDRAGAALRDAEIFN